MGKYLSEYATGRDNNFNLLRFIASSLVLFTHSFVLSIGSGDAEPLRKSLGMTWGSIAVDLFFITSGFLICGSYLAKKSIISFVWARILRIYPALIVSVLFTVYVLGLWLTELSINAYLKDIQIYKYLFKNSVLFFGIKFELPGVFDYTPYKTIVNGSLWTLPHEIRMYFILTILLASITFLSKRIHFITLKNSLIFIGILSAFFNIYNHFYPLLLEDTVRLFYMFLCGSAFYAWRDRIRLSSKFFFAAFLLVILSAIHKDLFFVFYCLALPYLIFYMAYVPAGKIRRFNNLGDYSYGMYIYAFPVQQTFAALMPGISVTPMIIVSFLSTLPLAVISWWLIEKRALGLKGLFSA